MQKEYIEYLIDCISFPFPFGEGWDGAYFSCGEGWNEAFISPPAKTRFHEYF